MTQAIEKIGAGEGNRTLVFSLEGVERASNINASSDNAPPTRTIVTKRLFGFVRTRGKP